MKSTSAQTPAQLGYRMPAEWARHQATWLTWPRQDGISFPDFYEGIPEVWAKMAALIAEGEEVHINIFSEVQDKEARIALKKEGVKIGERVFLHPFPAYEPWCRDHGPIFVHRPDEVAIINWKYNAWGGKYLPYDLDDEIPQRVAEFMKLPVFDVPMVLEGGSIDSNGEGTLLTTEGCLLHPNRNPGMTQLQIEKTICAYLGVEKILWLGDGIVGDDTDGHVDDLSRFVGPRTVVTIIEEDPDDDNYEALKENRRRLEGMTTARGENLQVIDLPTPGIVELHGQRVPASYANFYIANTVVLLPTFRHSNDVVAKETLQKLFPTRRVVAVDASDLIYGWGAFHCATQQQPAAKLD